MTRSLITKRDPVTGRILETGREDLSPEEYLASKIVKTNSCWLWLGADTGQGYGQWAYKKDWGSAHRKVYEYFVSPIPEGQIVRHMCDNPRCVNPEHLILGSKKDNRRDFMERNPRARELVLSAVQKASVGRDKFWTRLTPEEKKAFCKKRAEIQKAKRLSSFTGTKS
jgi:hypothetical protein